MSCPVCEWSAPAKADGTIQTLRAGSLRHAVESVDCTRKAVEVDHDIEAEIFTVKIFV